MVKHKLLLCLVVTVSLVMTQGCASIVSDSKYPVTIKSSPEGAHVVISSQHQEKMQSGVTPMTVTLPTKCDKCRFYGGEDYTVTFNKEGYNTHTVQLTRNVDGWYILGNIVFGGLVGWLIVDPATGAMWKLDESVTGSLQQVSSTDTSSTSLNIVMLEDLPEKYHAGLVPIGQ